MISVFDGVAYDDHTGALDLPFAKAGGAAEAGHWLVHVSGLLTGCVRPAI
jgi:hypothetical protein